MKIEEIINSPELEERVLEIWNKVNVKTYKPTDILSAKEACEYLNIKSRNPSAVLRSRSNPKTNDYPLKRVKGFGKEHKYMVKDLDDYKKYLLNQD